MPNYQLMGKSEESESGKPVYTLSIASRLSDIPAHSIRQYIDRGLLIPFKLDSKRHLFSPNDINRLNHIHLLIHEQGLNFAGIKALMAMIPCWAIRPCSESDKKGGCVKMRIAGSAMSIKSSVRR